MGKKGETLTQEQRERVRNARWGNKTPSVAGYVIGIDPVKVADVEPSSGPEVTILKHEPDNFQPVMQNDWWESNVVKPNENRTTTYTSEVNIQRPQTNYMSEVLEMPVAPRMERVKGKISIKAYSSGEEKMGLEKYNESLFPGTYQIDHIGVVDRNGYKTYFTGLDEQAPEVQSIKDLNKKRAKIKSIREVVAYLENVIANNYEVSAETCMVNFGSKDKDKPDDFYKYVTTFNSSGPDKFDARGFRKETYWDKVELKLDNDGLILDLTNAHDLVKFHAIEARGLSLVAPSLQVAIDEPGYNFYLDQPEETSDIKTQFTRLRNKAGGYLEDMLDLDQFKLFLMSINCALVGASLYKRGGPGYTPPKQMYGDLDNYISGKTTESDIRITVKKFLQFYEMPTDELNKRAVLKCATEMRLIEPKGDGTMFYMKTNVGLGRTMEEMTEYLKSPLNESTWEELRNDVETVWAQ